MSTVSARPILGDVTNTVCEDADAIKSKEPLRHERAASPTATASTAASVAATPSPSPALAPSASSRRLHHRTVQAPLPSLVGDCAEEFLLLWRRTAAEGGARMQTALQKFACIGPPPFVSVLSRPPQSVLPPIPGVEVWPTWYDLPEEDIPQLPTPSASSRSGNSSPTASSDIGVNTDSSLFASPVRDYAEARRRETGTHPELNRNGLVYGQSARALEALHVQSQRYLPKIDAVQKGLSGNRREPIVIWLIQVCFRCGQPDSVLYLAIELFDRYCAAVTEEIPSEKLHVHVLAILSLSMKMIGGAEGTGKSWQVRAILASLCQSFDMEDVFRAELRVLTALNFATSQPSALDFLEALVMPYTVPDQPDFASPVLCLAKFMLQLSLLESPLHYRYSHAVLAAGAIYVALWCTQADTAKCAILLSNVAATTGWRLAEDRVVPPLPCSSCSDQLECVTKVNDAVENLPESAAAGQDVSAPPLVNGGEIDEQSVAATCENLEPLVSAPSDTSQAKANIEKRTRTLRRL